MTLRDFMLLLLQALSGDRAAVGNVCRAIVLACPLVTAEPGQGDILLTISAGPLLKPVRVKIVVEKTH